MSLQKSIVEFFIGRKSLVHSSLTLLAMAWWWGNQKIWRQHNKLNSVVRSVTIRQCRVFMRSVVRLHDPRRRGLANLRRLFEIMTTMPTTQVQAPSNRSAMPQRKQRIALYMPRQLDLAAYANLIEIATGAVVVTQEKEYLSLSSKVADCAADRVVVDGSLASAEVCNRIQGLVEAGIVLGGAILASKAAAQNFAGMPSAISVVSDARRLVRWIEGESIADLKSTEAASLPKIGVPSLTKREREVWRQIAQGHAVREIANLFQLAESTVDSHKSRLMKKLDVHKSVDLVRLAIRYGIIDP